MGLWWKKRQKGHQTRGRGMDMGFAEKDRVRWKYQKLITEQKIIGIGCLTPKCDSLKPHVSKKLCSLWRGPIGSRTEWLMHAFSYQESSSNRRAWVPIRAHCQVLIHTPLPHEIFWPPWNYESDLHCDDLESSLLGPIQGTWLTSNSTAGCGGKGCKLNPEFLQRAAMLHLSHHNSHCPSFFTLHHDVLNPTLTISYPP